MHKAKRQRSTNFTLQERDILVSLVIKYQTVLENKSCNATTCKKKEAAWECIKNEFNARSGGTFRSTRTLKIKYKGLKRTVRKKSASLRSELYRTGAGRNIEPPLDNMEEKIKAMIIDGPESIDDSDVLPQTEESQGNVQKKMLFDELNQAKLELVQLQKGFLEAEIAEKKQVWQFEENERRKESEFREKERKWKEEEYKLKLAKLRKELKE